MTRTSRALRFRSLPLASPSWPRYSEGYSNPYSAVFIEGFSHAPLVHRRVPRLPRMPRRRRLPLLPASVPCVLAVAALGACAAPADRVTSAALGTSSTTTGATRSAPKAPQVDRSPVALRKAWSVAVDPIARARNVSYDTVLTMMLPGKDGWRAKVVVSGGSCSDQGR